MLEEGRTGVLELMLRAGAPVSHLTLVWVATHKQPSPDRRQGVVRLLLEAAGPRRGEALRQALAYLFNSTREQEGEAAASLIRAVGQLNIAIDEVIS